VTIARLSLWIHGFDSLLREGQVRPRPLLSAHSLRSFATPRSQLNFVTLKSGGFAQVLTTLMPLGRPGYPDEIAKAVLFLASDMAKSVAPI
jgi:NAD(P)-dependent dehydrogenase (short-subunit alcohol dehydrogenase family)